LLYQEWKLSQGPVVALALLWFIGLWVLVIFHHPAWLLAVGLIHVMTLSSAQAGRDVIDGTEEFSFTLPPGRGPLFLARLTPGFLFLTLNGLLGGAAIALDLPQRIWSLVFSSGLTDPFPAVHYPLWYVMVLFVPVAAHAITFSTAALAGSRAGVNLSWLAGAVGAGAIVIAGFSAEDLLWRAPNGFLTIPALFAVAVLVPFGGYQAYLRKEASGSSGVANRNGSRSGFVIAAIIVAIIVVLFMSLMFFRLTAVSHSATQNEIRVRQAEEERQREAERENAMSAPPASPARPAEAENH
jgi:uncharacterized membrane protein